MQNKSERLIYDRKIIESAAAGTNNLRTNKVKPGRIQKVRIVVVENKTSAYTKLRVGIFDNGVFYGYFEEMNPQADELVFVTDEMVLREGQQIQAELQGCTAGDSLEMYTHGHWEPETWEESDKKPSEEK